MAAPYITKADIEARISPATVRRILDDNNDGEADVTAVDMVIQDAQSYVDARLKGHYSPIPLNKDGGDVPTEVVRLTLDVAVAYMANRHPEYVRRDGMAMLERASKELKELQMAQARLNTDTAPEPHAGVGGEVLSGIPNTPGEDDGDKKYFTDGTGDF